MQRSPIYIPAQNTDDSKNTPYVKTIPFVAISYWGQSNATYGNHMHFYLQKTNKFAHWNQYYQPFIFIQNFAIASWLVRNLIGLEFKYHDMSLPLTPM